MPHPITHTLLVLSCLITTSLHAQPTTPDDKTIAYLKKFRSDARTFLLNKQPQQLQPYYAEDIRLMTESQKTMIGRDNAINYFKALTTRFDIKAYDKTAIEILDLGSMILEDGTLDLRMSLNSTGQLYHLIGKYHTIWEKSSDGQLVLLTEAWNYDQPTDLRPLDLAQHLRFPDVPVVDVALRPHIPINNNISFELAGLNRLMEATISQHDAKIWSMFYADDAMLFAQRHSICQGRKAIDEYIEEHIRQLPVFEHLDVRNDRVDDLGTYVIEYASHIANWRTGEVSGIGLGKDLRIWKRGKDGSLKIFRQIGAYD